MNIIFVFAESRLVENLFNPAKDFFDLHDDLGGSLREGQPLPQFTPRS